MRILNVLAAISIWTMTGAAVLAQMASTSSPLPEYDQLVRDMNRAAEFRSVKTLVRLPTEAELDEMDRLWPALPPQENAALVYARAFANIAYPDVYPAGSISGTQAFDGNVDALKRYTTIQGEAIRLGSSAARMPDCVFPILVPVEDGRQGALMAPLGPSRELARLFCDAGFLAELEGRYDEAADHYLGVLRMATHLKQGPMIYLLTGNAISQMGSGQLDHLLANAELSPEVLARLQEVCADAETSESDMVSMEGREIDVTRWLCGEGDWEEIQKSAAVWGFKLRNSIEEEMAVHVRIGDNFMLVHETPLHKVLHADYPLHTVLSEGVPKDYESARVRTGRVFLEGVGHTNAILRSLRIRAEMVSYHKQHADYPASLHELEPHIGEAALLDPFSGQPFKYKRSAEGWTLWSVGSDLKDDRGDDKTPLREGTWWTKDIVFRSQLESNAEVRTQ